MDTNVYLALFSGKSNKLGHEDTQSMKNEQIQHTKAKDILSNNENKIFVSDLIFMEILSSLRKHLSKNPNSNFESQVKGGYNKILGLINASPTFILNDTSIISFSTILTVSRRILDKTNGHIKDYDKCDNCGTRRNYRFVKKYKCVSLVDIFHVLIAKENQCEKFITFDKGFNEIKDYEDIKPLEIEIR